MVQFSERHVDECILLTRIQADSLRCAFRLIHSPNQRLSRCAIIALRARQRENDKSLLTLRLLWHRQAEHGVDIFAAQGILDGAGGLVDQADLALEEVEFVVDELQSELFAQGRGEADVFAFEVYFGWVGDVVAAMVGFDCARGCFVGLFEFALFGGGFFGEGVVGVV